MGLTRLERIACPCGHSWDAHVYATVNPARVPQARQQLVDRTFHTFECAACDKRVVVEAEFTYLDLERRQLLGHFSELDRERGRECSERLVQTWRQAIVDGPAHLRPLADRFLVRVCFGLEELREKIVADDAGLADLPLEVLKADLLAREGWFRQAAVVTLRLEEVQGDGSLLLLPVWAEPLPRGHERPPIVVERELYEGYAERGQAELLRLRPRIASGPWCSVLRLAYVS